MQTVCGDGNTLYCDDRETAVIKRYESVPVSVQTRGIKPGILKSYIQSYPYLAKGKKEKTHMFGTSVTFAINTAM